MPPQESQSLVEQVRLVRDYWPLVTFARQLVAETDPYRRALIFTDVAEWLASKTGTRFDDEAVRLLEQIAQTPQGEQLIRWLLKKVEVME